MKNIRFGIIGCGLMGKEFASASARWCHLRLDVPRPEIVAVCDTNPEARQWFVQNFPTVSFETGDYHDLLARADVDAVYCALPHVLHEQVYVDIIEAGKHLLGEKPLRHRPAGQCPYPGGSGPPPGAVVRCASEFPIFRPAGSSFHWIQAEKFGRILEVKAGFNHASDLDTGKPINWKRRRATNGEYGCMGDLGIHTQHVPFRMGWRPKTSMPCSPTWFGSVRTEGRHRRVRHVRQRHHGVPMCGSKRHGISDVHRNQAPFTGLLNEWYLKVFRHEGIGLFHHQATPTPSTTSIPKAKTRRGARSPGL